MPRIIAGSLSSPTLGVDVVETKWIDHGTWQECIGYTVHVQWRGTGAWCYYRIAYTTVERT